MLKKLRLLGPLLGPLLANARKCLHANWSSAMHPTLETRLDATLHEWEQRGVADYRRASAHVDESTRANRNRPAAGAGKCFHHPRKSLNAPS